jgi:hypothetical protein
VNSDVGVIFPSVAYENVSIISIVLPKSGTYVIGGQQAFTNFDPSLAVIINCQVLANTSPSWVAGLPVIWESMASGQSTTAPISGYYSGAAGTTLTLVCYSGGPSTSVEAVVNGSMFAMQIQ